MLEKFGEDLRAEEFFKNVGGDFWREMKVPLSIQEAIGNESMDMRVETTLFIKS